MAQGQMEKNHMEWPSSPCFHLSTNRDASLWETHIWLTGSSQLAHQAQPGQNPVSKIVPPSSFCQNPLAVTQPLCCKELVTEFILMTCVIGHS